MIIKISLFKGTSNFLHLDASSIDVNGLIKARSPITVNSIENIKYFNYTLNFTVKNYDINEVENYFEISNNNSSQNTFHNYSIVMKIKSLINITMVRISLDVIFETSNQADVNAQILLDEDFSQNCYLLNNNFKISSNWDNQRTQRNYRGWFACQNNNSKIKTLNSKILIIVESEQKFILKTINIYLLEDYKNERNPTKPTCRKPETSAGVVIHEIEEGHIYNLTCMPEFVVVDGTNQFACESTKLLRCSPKTTCTKLESVQWSKFVNETFYYRKVFIDSNINNWYPVNGTEALIKCKNGDLSQNKTVICGSDGSWNESCYEKNTGIIETPKL